LLRLLLLLKNATKVLLTVNQVENLKTSVTDPDP
jgi:hypothetical protein